MDTRKQIFEPIGSKADFPALEREVMEYWKVDDTFRESLRIREGAHPFVFYDGPPTANGNPATQHIRPRSYEAVCDPYGHKTRPYVGR